MSVIETLIARGVKIPTPAAVVVEDVDPERFEAGVVIHPGTTVSGMYSAFGRGTHLGRAGGGYFRDVVTGRGCDLYGGYFEDCALMDGVVVRGHAELRGGTLLEEGCEAAHHVGYKMTIMLPFTVAGSLVNFCDAVFAGGSGRDDHGEIGSCMALYNYTPWGDKFASMFGNVVEGVFLRKPRVFVGGQTQIVSPVIVGFGSVVAAGSGLRRNVGERRLVGDVPVPVDQEFDGTRLGAVLPKLVNTLEIIGNLRGLEAWYLAVRGPHGAGDGHATRLVEHGLRQIRAAIAERVRRLEKFMTRVEPSLRAHRDATGTPGDSDDGSRNIRRAIDHEKALEAWTRVRPRLGAGLDDSLCTQLRHSVVLSKDRPYIEAVRSLDDAAISEGTATLRAIVASCTA